MLCGFLPGSGNPRIGQKRYPIKTTEEYTRSLRDALRYPLNMTDAGDHRSVTARSFAHHPAALSRLGMLSLKEATRSSL